MPSWPASEVEPEEIGPRLRFELGRLRLGAAGPDGRDVVLTLRAAVELGQVLAYENRIEDAVRECNTSWFARGEGGHGRVVEMMLLVLAETDVAGRAAAAPLLAAAGAVVDRLGERSPLGLLAVVAVEHALVDGDGRRAGSPPRGPAPAARRWS